MSRNYYNIVNNKNKELELIIKKSYNSHSSDKQINNNSQITKFLLQIIDNKNDDDFYDFFKKYILIFQFKKQYYGIVSCIDQYGKLICNPQLKTFNRFYCSVIDFIEKCCFISITNKCFISSITEIDNYYKELFIFLNDIINICQKLELIEEIRLKLIEKEQEKVIEKEKEIKKEEVKKKKKAISATIKRLVWNTNIGEDIGKFKCLCCNSTDITQMSFNCGHIIAEANGGETIVSNLKPICQNCNSSMGTKNMNDFIKSLK